MWKALRLTPQPIAAFLAPMKFGIDDHPIYKPLLNRLVIVGIAALWVAFEVFYAKESLWTYIAVAVLAYCVYALFIRPPKGEPPQA
ncbi:MAG: hypothetical protein LCH46_02935 [Proteobacteria bacterium]|nr:hypothetical protein [Pseudomonadota bacterium]